VSEDSGYGGNQLAGNIIVGLGLGWLAQHYFPGIAPWGLAGGIILGAISGFYQVLKGSGAFESFKAKDKDTEPKDGSPRN